MLTYACLNNGQWFLFAIRPKDVNHITLVQDKMNKRDIFRRIHGIELSASDLKKIARERDEVPKIDKHLHENFGEWECHIFKNLKTALDKCKAMSHHKDYDPTDIFLVTNDGVGFHQDAIGSEIWEDDDDFPFDSIIKHG